MNVYTVRYKPASWHSESSVRVAARSCSAAIDVVKKLASKQGWKSAVIVDMTFEFKLDGHER